MVSLCKASDLTPTEIHARALVKRVRDAGQPNSMMLPTAVRSYGIKSPVTREVRRIIFGR